MKNLYQSLNNNKIKNKKNANKFDNKDFDYFDKGNIKDIQLENNNEKEVEEISSYSNRLEK